MDFSNLATLFFIGLCAFAFTGWSNRTSDPDEYHTVQRKAGPIRTAASIFTLVGAPHYAIFTSISFFYGWWGLVFYLGTLTGLIALSAYTPAIRAYIRNDAHTFSDIASQNIGQSGAAFLSLFSILFTAGVLIAQLIVGAGLISAVSNISYSMAVAGLALSVLLYLIGGGYRSLLFTDVVQGALMLLFTIILVAYLAYHISTGALGAAVFSPPKTLPLSPMIPLLYIAGILAIVGGPETWQRILTASSDKAAKRGLIGGGATMLFWGIFVIATANCVRAIDPDANPDTAFINATTQFPEAIAGVILVCLLAALLSTADTELFTTAVLIQKEWKRYKNDLSTQLSIRFTQICMGAITIACIELSIAANNLMAAWGVLINLVYIMGPLALSVAINRGGRSKKIRKAIFFASLTVSTIIFITIVSYQKSFFSWWTLLVIGAASIPLLIPGASQSPAKRSNEN